MATDEGLASLTASEAADQIAHGTVSAEEYVRACLERIETVDGTVRAFAHIDAAHVVAQAQALDERRRNGQPIGPLHGIPVAIQDVIDTGDYPTELGSPAFSGRRPLHDATVIARLRSAGAVILGKTVTTEFGFTHPGATRNPRDPRRTPGGAASGSAAAVAAGLAPIAIGTQTMAGVIQPASYCGVFGLKPSHGMVSRAGVLPLSGTLDHVGVLARTLEDIALVLDVVAGHDPADGDTRPVAAPAFASVLAERPPLPPRFAFIRTPFWDKADADTQQSFEQLVARLGNSAQEVELPERFRSASDLHRAILSADMAHNLGDAVAKAGETASRDLRDQLADGRKVTAVQYLAALKDARLFGVGLAEVFNMYDAIITPAAPGVAPLGLDAIGDPDFGALWTLIGLPALSLPILQGENELPLGVQLVGPGGDDARLLRSARWLLDTLSGKRPQRGRRGPAG
jgi:Asp-tRNA(Asn)/Glu-tRNA(Gln) amidotransferase A subunit family amidase